MFRSAYPNKNRQFNLELNIFFYAFNINNIMLTTNNTVSPYND